MKLPLVHEHNLLQARERQIL